MTDESETPDATLRAGHEPSSGAEPPPGAERSTRRDGVSGARPPRAARGPSDHPDDLGRVIAFPARPGAVDSTGSADRDDRETGDRDGARPEGSGRLTDGRKAVPQYGLDVDNERDVGTLRTDARTDHARSTDLITTDRTTDGPSQGDGADDDRPADWAWVEEWRAGGEPVPWATGLGLAGFSALVVGVAVWVLSAGLAATPVLAIGVNVLVAGGLAPAMWLSRGLPVLRWIALGSAVGVLAGWICALTMLPLPTR